MSRLSSTTRSAALVLLCLVIAVPAGAATQPVLQEPSDVTASGEEFASTDARFVPLARDEMIPAGETRHFEVRSAPFARVSLLAAGRSAAADGAVRMATLFGPPMVPAGPPQPLHIGERGGIVGRSLQPVLGPAMIVVIHNDTSAPVVLNLSAYFTD